ncbi:amino acid ABC transporter permease [Albidovulum sp.]|uniref:amino acid ABC transporter permease n=1 Tax=Albidovulum sp. TaxID=1872424 RepID=UPI0039B87091
MLAIFGNLVTGVPMTLILTFGALLIGVVLGVPICMARQSRHGVLSRLAAALIVAIRSVPPLVWLFLVYFGLGSGILRMSPLVAALSGLGLITAVNMAEIYRGSLAAIHSGQWEASQALGLPRWSRLVEIIGPQVARISLPAVATYAIGLLKDSAVASIIGVPELAFRGTYLSQQTFKGLEIFMAVGLLYIAMSLPVAWASRVVDARIRLRVAK